MSSVNEINRNVTRLNGNSNVNQTETALIEVGNNAPEMFHRPSFFRIILEAANVEEVRIPHHFVKYIGEEPSNTAILRDPRGGTWHVNLCRESEGIFLSDGWQEFTKHNSLRSQDFLLFTYCGNLCFDVKIFDKNGLERIETSIANDYEAALSINERRGSPTKLLHAATSSGKRGRRPQLPKEAPSQKKVSEKSVGTSLCSDIQAFDSSRLKSMQTRTSRECLEAGKSGEKRRRGKPRKARSENQAKNA